MPPIFPRKLPIFLHSLGGNSNTYRNAAKRREKELDRAMKILAVDLGKARTGLAVCDEMELLASPVGTIAEYNRENLCRKVAEQARKLHVEEIVLGLPKNMDGSEGESAQNAREFAHMLEETSGIPVVLRDERLTTVSAHGYLNATDTRGKKRKAVVDTVSAVLILENYLAYRKNQQK